MTLNDVLRSLRHTLNINEIKLVEIIRLANYDVDRALINSYLKKEEEEGYEECSHTVMAHFLDGLIYYKRGKDENRPIPPIELPVTNNIILKKLRVAFELKDTDIVALIEKCGLRVSKAELNAFFRSPVHRNYRECGDQFLRNLLKGLTP